MTKEKKPEIVCHFCNIKKIEEEKRIIKKVEMEINNNKETWFAFIPQDPEIFGHCIVTYKKSEKLPHIQNIGCNNIKRMEILKILNEGIVTIVDGLKKIKNVEMVYFAMLGETIPTHMHYHLFPRYNILDDEDKLNKWADNNTLLSKDDGSNEDFQWIKFFAKPTKGFKSFTGFQYLGEIEASQQYVKNSIGRKPSKNLVEDMAKKIIDICKFE